MGGMAELRSEYFQTIHCVPLFPRTSRRPSRIPTVMTMAEPSDDAQRGITAIQDAGENAPAILVSSQRILPQGAKRTV